jgi:hypothetical protein
LGLLLVVASVAVLLPAGAIASNDAPEPTPVCNSEHAPTAPSTAGLAPLRFGIYAGSAAGTAEGTVATGPADQPPQIEHALNRLQGSSAPLSVRGYVPFNDSLLDPYAKEVEPANFAYFARHGRRLDVALVYDSPSGDLAAWKAFVRRTVREYAPFAATFQISEEPNLVLPHLDGSFPHVKEAVVQGVLTAHETLEALGDTEAQVGFNTAGPDQAFYASLGELGGTAFAEAVDYVGIDLFPGAFGFVPPSYRQAVADALRSMRLCSLRSAGISDAIPIHVTENGWPTSSTRSEADQAAALREIVQAVSDYRGMYNVTSYELFSLRDADSTVDNISYQFGILRSDYTPKPAFFAYQEMIRRLNRRGPHLASTDS